MYKTYGKIWNINVYIFFGTVIFNSIVLQKLIFLFRDLWSYVLKILHNHGLLVPVALVPTGALLI